MKRIHFHVNEIEWQTFTEEKWGALRWRELLNLEQGNSKEFIFGLAELPEGGRLPLHTHAQAEIDYLLSGRAVARLGSTSVELGSASTLYFPGRAPHSIETLGSESLRYIYTYACERLGHKLETDLAEETAATQLNILNKENTRWAICEEIEKWIWVEPSKGFRVRVRRLFDNQLTTTQLRITQEMMAGIVEIDPLIHYTLHYHEQPEIFYVLAGRGFVYVGNSAIKVFPGSAIYIGSRVVHGADSIGQEALRMYFIYGAETAGQDNTWTPAEDIYTEVRLPK
jgi:mannose-6-phosphate isomerase-like protein (cupin superfamily)